MSGPPTETGEILFLAHRIPFPPDRGDKIRSHHVLRALAALAPVHVATFAETSADLAEADNLASVAATYRLAKRATSLVRPGLRALAARLPVSLTAFHDPALAEYVRATIAARRIAAIYVFSGQMGQYIPEDFAGRVIADFVDVDSAKFEEYAAAGTWPRRWIDAREGLLLRAEETRVAARADASLLVTAAEAALFAARLPAGSSAAARVRVLPNGIDTALYDPFEVLPETAMRDFTGPRLIFTGQMDYAPNIAAVVRTARGIMPLIRQRFLAATFHIVGRSPPRAVYALDGVNGCHVWGAVADVRPFLAAAELALVPLGIARGVQNKVLEAMAMALPVVVSRAAATGIAAADGQHLAIGDSDADLAGRAIALLGDPGRARLMGLAARRFVVDNYSWEGALEALPALIQPTAAAAPLAAADDLSGPGRARLAEAATVYDAA